MQDLLLAAAAGYLDQALAVEIGGNFEGEAVLYSPVEPGPRVLLVVLAEKTAFDESDLFVVHLLQLVAFISLQLLTDEFEQLELLEDVHRQFLRQHHVEVLEEQVQLLGRWSLDYFEFEGLEDGFVELERAVEVPD